MTVDYTSNTDKIVLPTAADGFTIPGDVDLANVASDFLSKLSTALTSADGQALTDLLIPTGYWRDTLAFTREYRCFSQHTINAVYKDIVPATKVQNLKVANVPSPEVQAPFSDLSWVKVHFTFDATIGKCGGVARLVFVDGAWKTWTLFTTIDELAGHPQIMGHNRPYGNHNAMEPHDEKRRRELEFADSDPDALVIGAGHNGLAIAAQLKSFGLNPLVVDKQARLGDNWRKRYASLSLHDLVFGNHLPFMPFPINWPVFIPAGKVANWIEYYAEAMEINVWLETTVDGTKSSFNETSGTWTMVVQRKVDGEIVERTINVSHVVLATGLIGGKKYLPPPYPGQAEWKGTTKHTSEHGSGKGLKDKRVLVVGASTSGHDVSVDLVNHGAKVTMLQRSPTFVMSFKAGLPVLSGGGLYSQNSLDRYPVEVIDRIADGFPRLVTREMAKRSTAYLAQADAELLAGLKRVGFKTWPGPDGTGFMTLAQEKGGGFYFTAGGSEMIVEGKISIKQGEIARFGSGNSVHFSDGSEGEFDLVLFATGYTGFRDTVAETLGPKAADALKPIWGLDAEGEMKGVARDVGVPHAMLMVGNFMSSRSMSKNIAMQIVAQRDGTWGKPYLEHYGE